MDQPLTAGSASCSHQRRPVNVGSGERVASILTGGGLALVGLRHLNSLAGLALTAVGGGLIYRGASGFCGLYQVLGVSTCRARQTAVPARQGSRVEKSILVCASPAEVYRFWRRLENLPRFLNHLVAVEAREGTRSHWVAEGPLGVRVEWDAELINDKPNEVIAWRSLAGSQVDTAGAVRLTADPQGRGTRVSVELKYNPPGGQAGIALAHLLGDAPDQQLASDLFRLKRVIEAGEQSAAGHGHAQPRTANGAVRTGANDCVEETSVESFPASDPPAWTAGAATNHPQRDEN